MLRGLTPTAVATFASVLVSGGNLIAQSLQQSEGAAHALRIAVPEVGSSHVVTDGTFSPSEWDGAYQHRISENCEAYVQADSTHLYVGFRFLKDVEADFVSEVYLATSEREFLNLHSSGALGEGLNSFSPDLRRAAFTVDSNTGWESNVTGIGARTQGKEYKISRAILPGVIVKMAGGMTIVNWTMRETANFPEHYGFGDADDWVVLVLPASPS